MVPFEVLSSIEVGGLMKLCMYSGRPIERRVAGALIHLTMCRSENWKGAMESNEEEAVRVEVSLEDLAIILERVDFCSGRAEDVQAIKFWPHLLTAIEFLETLDFRWETNDYGFDCYDSYMVRWLVPEGLVGYLVWLLREGRAGADIPAEFRYREFRQKRAALVEKLSSALAQHVETGVRPKA